MQKESRSILFDIEIKSLEQKLKNFNYPLNSQKDGNIKIDLHISAKNKLKMLLKIAEISILC